MKIDHVLIDKLAGLSKLEFSDSEKIEILHDLNKMVDFIDKLQEIPVDNIEPLVYMMTEQNILRDDIVVMEISKNEALKNAPLADSDYIKVPKVFKQSN